MALLALLVMPILLLAIVGTGMCALLWYGIRQQQHPPVPIFRLALLASAAALVLLIGPPMFFLGTSAWSYAQVASVQLDNQTYHLARHENISDPPDYLLFQCESSGIFCDVAAQVPLAYEDTQNAVGRIVLTADPAAHTLTVRLDGVIKWVYSP